ncbi:glycine--tRNA ligase subunit beta [Novosphingobium bradum]|uniref:Glycine--tRNA ligase beta subunit n=1 Tax=Novosphingobium bradum TaxID=1737444 RepID=A0ABV7IQ44_9SPHN
MSDFLLELRSEEIPARMQAGARASLEKLFREQMQAAGVSLGELTVYSTPRRLALIARGLPQATAAVSEEVKGPKVGAPPQALEGFLRKTGLTQDQLVERGGVLFAVTEKPGRATRDVLAEAIPAICRAFLWPKSMRWGKASLSTESLRWVRPLSSIVAILGEELVPCEVGGVRSGYATLGHRFHHPGEITIGGADDYVEKLRACHVLVDHAEREGMVREMARAAALAAGLTLVDDEGLVIENAGLTEWPVPLLGRFDEAYLEVPPEVIQLTARTNQKYFICRDSAGKLANAFVCTANIAASDGGAGIVAGNRKVLAARLSDARFFWQQDRKTALSVHGEKLGRITFHEKLGTVADKVERVARLAEWLASEGIVPNCDPALARKAAELCKADLVTEMVGEFPELQGLMGGYYARAEGLGDAVSDAIRDHYKPVGQGDEVPTAPVTVAVALADKLDTIRSFFAIDEKPTGSKDPFALRRAALGMIQIVMANGLRFGIGEGDVLAFFADRLKVQQKEAGVRHDLIDAVFALGGEDDLVRLLARVHALQAFVATEDGANLHAGYKRAANILKKEDWQGVEARIPRSGDEDPMSNVDDPDMRAVAAARGALMHQAGHALEPAEAALVAALDRAEPAAKAAVGAEDFAGAMAALAALRGPIDAFFDQVTVNDADANKRAFRLDLLARFRAAVHNVADFSRIEG